MPSDFIFKGTQSTDLGVYVTQYPPPVIPAERAVFKSVPGRNGSLTLLEGADVYDDITLSIDCFVRDLSNIDKIAAWLRGRGDLILGNEPSKCYHARAVNQIEFNTVVRARTARVFTAVFRCDSFRYEVSPEDIILTRAHIVTNAGSVEALPVIEVTGSGNISLAVGDVSVTLTGIGGTVALDSDAKTAYQGATQAGGMITLDDGQWPTFPVGDTPVSWTGNVTSVKITPHWRWL